MVEHLSFYMLNWICSHQERISVLTRCQNWILLEILHIWWLKKKKKRPPRFWLLHYPYISGAGHDRTHLRHTAYFGPVPSRQSAWWVDTKEGRISGSHSYTRRTRNNVPLQGSVCKWYECFLLRPNQKNPQFTFLLVGAPKLMEIIQCHPKKREFEKYKVLTSCN